MSIDGKAAYLAFVSPGQINLQVPNDTASGAVPAVVTTAFGSAASTVTLAQFGPSFFLLDAKHVAGIILQIGRFRRLRRRGSTTSWGQPELPRLRTVAARQAT